MIMDSSKLLKTISFAIEAHGLQSRKARKSKHVPYMVHPIEVCRILMDCIVAHQDLFHAAILHDVLEDTDKTENDIANLFGVRVLDIVKGLTDDKTKTKEEQRKAQIEKMLTASKEVRMIKIADKTSNLRDLVRCPPGWKISSVKAYTEHATQVVLHASLKQDVPEDLVSMFWSARNDVLNWVAEEEEKLKEKESAVQGT